MSVYQPLADFLTRRKDDRWDASFGEIQDILGRPLPESAFRYQPWWANQKGRGHSQTHGWRSAGWRTSRVDLERRRVTFERDRTNPAKPATRLETLLDRASRITGIDDRDMLIASGLEALIAREAAHRLGELGGAMPDYKAPDRERP